MSEFHKHQGGVPLRGQVKFHKSVRALGAVIVWHSARYVGMVMVMLLSVGSTERVASLCGSSTRSGAVVAIENPADIPKWSGSAWSMLNSSLSASLGCQSVAISSGLKDALD